jgi:NtrC-family two-component system sensor histidine kinase KinB
VRLRRKLLLAAVPAIVTLGALGAYSAGTIERLGGAAEEILRDNYKSIRVVQRLHDVRADVEHQFLSRGQVDLAVVESRLATCTESLAVQRGNVTEPGEDEATAELGRAFETWSAAVRASAAAPRGRALEVYLERAHASSEALRLAGTRIVTLNQEAIVRKTRDTTLLAEQLRRRVVVLFLAAFTTLVVVGVLAASHLSRPLVELTRAVRALGEGDLDRPLPRAKGDDEVALLVREVARMAEALREYRRSSLGELIAAQQLAQAAIDSLRDPVLSFGPDRRVRQVNAAAGRLLGVDPDAQDPLGRVPAELRAAIGRARDRVLAGRGSVVPEGLADAIPAMVHGAVRQVQLHATPTVRRGAGEIVGATVLVRDVTSLHAAAALKDDLLSTVAHELRTPLTSLRMAVHMVLEQAGGPLTDKQQELLAAAREDAERLHALIEGILSLARMEEGGLAARRRPVAPAELVEAVVGPLRVTAGDRRIELVATAVSEPSCLADRESTAAAEDAGPGGARAGSK